GTVDGIADEHGSRGSGGCGHNGQPQGRAVPEDVWVGPPGEGQCGALRGGWGAGREGGGRGEDGCCVVRWLEVDGAVAWCGVAGARTSISHRFMPSEGMCGWSHIRKTRTLPSGKSRDKYMRLAKL